MGDFSMMMVCTSDGFNMTWYKGSADCGGATKVGSYVVNATEFTKLKAGQCAAATYDGSTLSPNRYVMIMGFSGMSAACTAPAPGPAPAGAGSGNSGNATGNTTAAPKATSSKSGFSPSLLPGLAVVALGALGLSH